MNSQRLSTQSQGARLEQDLICQFHERCDVVLLVSPLLLRRMGCGQIDGAGLWGGHRPRIVVCEVKSCGEIGPRQLSRLRKSANFLSLHLDLMGQIICIQQSDHLTF